MDEKQKSLGRSFRWEDVSPRCAILRGPSPCEKAAIVEWILGKEDTGEWAILSIAYPTLNETIKDSSATLERMKRRALIALGTELQRRKQMLEEDCRSVSDLLFEGEEEDPYVWPEL